MIKRPFNHGQVVQDFHVKWIADHWSDGLPSGSQTAFGFLEIPFDYAVSHRPGTRFGPEKIIECLNGCTLYCTDKRKSLISSHIRHFGVADIVHSLNDTYQNIYSKLLDIPDHYIPISIGGDHSITGPIMRAVCKKKQNHKVGLVVFDAHLDSRDPVPGKEHSGHWVKTLDGVIDYHNMVQIGIDGSIYSETYMKHAEEKGILVRTPYEIRKKGIANVLHEIYGYLLVDKLYISVDIDVINQSFAPGTSVPNPSGLFPYEVNDMVFELARHYMPAGFDIVEVSPPLDAPNNVTSSVATQCILNYMAGVIKDE